ncbi:MAG: hypothetical protein QM582_05820 [Micropruina sp.]|uniref:hypothetical protein n=1 Tax=Micropruina sp. TaxID=2737536 RepID=UPI0039E68A6E
MQSLLSAAFWRSMGGSLVRTAVAGITPFLPGLTSDPAATWPKAAATVGGLLVATVGTSLKGVPDPESAGWGELLTARGLRQFGQFLAGGLTGAALLSGIDWTSLLQQAGTSAASTVVLGALTVSPGDSSSGPDPTPEPVPDAAQGEPPFDHPDAYPAPPDYYQEEVS